MADSEAAVTSNRSILRFILSRLDGAGHYQTAPEDRISLIHKVIYGFGAFVNNLLAAAIGGMVIILNLGLGMNPALVGLLGALPRLTDAITDPLMGYISDNTRSRFGRRRPFIFNGAILVGLTFALMWQLPAGYSEMFYFWVFLGASILFFLTYTLYATPFVAFGYEMTADYHERTRLHTFANTDIIIPNSTVSSDTVVNYAFRDRLGVTPKQYLQATRLHRVRHAILDAARPRPISEIAARWGFWHMGQFAADYRRQFGELPSETLRRAKKTASTVAVPG